MYLGNKEQALQIYNSNGKTTISSIKTTAVVIDLSDVVYAKSGVTAAKAREQFSHEVVCSIQDISTSCSQTDVDKHFQFA